MLQRQKSIASDNSHQIMRCVIDDKGNLSFISPALAWSLGANGTYLMSTPAIEVMDVIGDSKNVRNKNEDRDSKNLMETKDGFYDIVLFRRARDPLLIETRIDNVTTHDGKKYKVLWMEPSKTGGKKEGVEFDKIAIQIADVASRLSKYRTEKVNDDKPDTDNYTIDASIDDGELRNFLNISNDLVAVYDRKGRFLRVNYAFNRILGYSDSDLKPIPFMDLIEPEDREHAERHMIKVMNADPDVEIRVDFEAKTKAKDGGMKWIEWVQKSAKNIIYIVGRDVTSIKQQEVQLEWREQQLSEAQKIGKMGHWHWVVGDDIVGWSDQIYSIFGVDKNKFIPTLESINTSMVERDIGTLFRSFKRAIVDKNDFSIEYCLKHPNGDLRYVRCQGRCQINEKTDEIEALFGIMQDITDRTLHEKALNEAKDAAEAAYASKTRFLANMSHELRTPLNAIIGFSEMMQRQLLGPIGNDRYLDYISGIRESGEHLLDLINDILDMAKIEVGKYELELEEVNVSKLIRLSSHMMEGRAQETNIQLLIDQVPEDIQIIADRRAVMQILLNILSNALKFTSENGKVSLECEIRENDIKIIITDNGVGIPKEKIDLVVMPFEQAGGALTRRHEGSGLGLSITKDLLEMHGGNIEITSKLGTGTSVSVIFPKVAKGY